MKPARIVLNEPIAEDLYLLEIELVEPIDKEPKPFQFASLWIPRVKEIPLSISYAELERSRFRFIYKLRGRGTRALSETLSGSFLGVKIPLGRGIDLRELRGKKLLVVCGGVGIAPLPYLVRVCSENGYEVHVVCGFRTRQGVPPIDLVFPISPHSVHIATEDCSVGYCGDALTLAKKVSKSENFDDLIFVGPSSMLKKACEEFRDVDPMISLETLVRCGLGLCGSCYIRGSTKLLCVDGPVFRCSEVSEYLAGLPD
ncbi:MAG TPA: hypothetical protein EYP48_03405 [Ignisphaera sp.]|nr:hypothetical protein [Ignisphaera sp.]